MKLNKYIAFIFLLAAIIVSIATYYSLTNSKLTNSLAEKEYSSEHQIARIQRLYSFVSNADEGVHYYVITGDAKYLVPSDTSYSKVKRLMKFLKDDAGNDSVLLPAAKELETNINLKLQYIDKLTNARQHSFDSAQKIVATAEGMKLMDTIKAEAMRLTGRERTERTKYAAQDQVYIDRTSLTIIIGELTAFIIILLVLLLLNRDMQRRIVSEKLLKESEIRYRTIAQNVGSFIYTCDYYGKITFATPNISTLTGYTPAEIIGKHFTFLVAADYVESIKQGYYTQFKNKIKEQTTEFELVTRTGLRKRVKQDVVIFSTEDMMMGFQCTIHDLSDANKF